MRMRYFLLLVVMFGAMSDSIMAQHYALKSVVGERLPVTRKYDLMIDADLHKLVFPYMVVVDSLMNSVVGSSKRRMEVYRPESSLSNWVADAMVEECELAGFNVDVGLCNIGGLRNSMPKGEVSIGDIISISPFNNKLYVLTLSGANLIRLFDQVASTGGECVSAAVSMIVDADKEIESLRLNGKKIKPKRMYHVVTIDYLADGNDGLTALKTAEKCVDTGLVLHELLIENIRRSQQQGKDVDSRVEGRIVYKCVGDR